MHPDDHGTVITALAQDLARAREKREKIEAAGGEGAAASLAALDEASAAASAKHDAALASIREQLKVRLQRSERLQPAPHSPGGASL